LSGVETRLLIISVVMYNQIRKSLNICTDCIMIVMATYHRHCFVSKITEGVNLTTAIHLASAWALVNSEE
jgi:hypothetical protein